MMILWFLLKQVTFSKKDGNLVENFLKSYFQKKAHKAKQQEYIFL